MKNNFSKKTKTGPIWACFFCEKVLTSKQNEEEVEILMLTGHKKELRDFNFLSKKLLFPQSRGLVVEKFKKKSKKRWKKLKIFWKSVDKGGKSGV